MNLKEMFIDMKNERLMPDLKPKEKDSKSYREV